VCLAEGSRVTIRPTLPQDIDLLLAFFRALSAQAPPEVLGSPGDDARRKQWPELSTKEALAEVVTAIAYASSCQPQWFWDGVLRPTPLIERRLKPTELMARSDISLSTSRPVV